MNFFVGFTGNQSSNEKSDAHVRVAWPFGQGAATPTQKLRYTGYITSVKIPIIKGKAGSLESLGQVQEYGEMVNILIKGNYPEMI